MRPEQLELEGFTAFRQHTVIDFADTDLFALSGPTGAGKSSLIDAIVFALYGTIPRLADRRRVGPVISQGLVQARLGFQFSVGPERYRAVRVVRATPSGGASTKEARLVRLIDGEPPELLAGDADEVSRRVERLLGLTYEHFTTAVVLPQGEFARFLHHKPADRQALLKELLDLGLYDRLQQRARRRADLAAEAGRFARSRLEELSGAGADRQAELHTQQVAMAALVQACNDALPELDELTRTLEASATAARAHRAAAEQLRSVVPPGDLEAPARAHAAAVARLADLEGHTTRYDQAVDEAATELSALPAEADSLAAIERHERLERQQALVDKGERAAHQARAKLDQAAVAAAETAAGLQQAEQALTAARTAHAAAALAEHLHAGDDCPVCGHTVTELPAFDRRVLAAATAAHAQAAEQAGRAGEDHRQAQLELARIDTKLEGERHRLDELATQVAAGVDLATAAANLDAARRAATRLREATAARRAHTAALEAARSALKTAEAAQEQLWAQFDAARDRLGGLEPPPAGRRDLVADWAALAEWATGRELEVLRQVAAAEAERDRLVEVQRRRLAQLTEQASTVLPDLARSATATAIRDRALAAEGRLAAELARLEEDRARAVQAEQDLAAAGEAEAVATLLRQLLQANRFGAWILDEAVQQLVVAATGLLQRLSGGAYSLVLEGKDFAVIDHNNADTVRSARTLSGGETFLASLALALALAEQVVMLAGPTAAPLESLFLDEGFGTLDPETLDTVAAAIEELGSEGRMVGIVTHVRDLAERLPVRYEVTKDLNGAHVERVLA